MNQGLVAIVGRPNVGKSTLFNRLTKTNNAIIHNRPGVTRDRLYGTVTSVDEDGSGYSIIDTGGFETKDLYYQPFAKNIVWEQTEMAIEEADVVLMVLDAKAGLHPHDRELVQYLHKLEKRVIYVANKVDGQEQTPAMWEFYELGLDHIYNCSAAHNRGVWDLACAIEDELEKVNGTKLQLDHDGATKIALIGRPNAGKSSILNRLCGENRSLVSDVAGTTRDTIDTVISYNKKPYVLLDTAGVRRRKKISDKLEGLMVIKSLRAIEDADIVVIVITADEGMSDQDARLASLAADKYKPVLIVVNKWDLIPNKDSNTAREYELDLREKLADISYFPVLFTSCLENKRIHKILQEVEALATAYDKRVPTARLNEVLERAVHEHTPALIRKLNKRVKFYYATQVRTMPPTIVVKCNVAGEIQESYKRYLTKRFRKDLEFGKTPLRVLFRGKKEEKEFKAQS
ncbi:ribosome biogenesis GTPase Der [Pseudobacteriovorax antillogorgiicola]|uniref:GTPase Der n=1 Tax=Pseudobacteriovorax antillogorgiicola TaxID=1513793 RepID=A0A1Y6CBP8_9BACT|nr:ribosome biogenesis GTPase Der [Pseudobacteriovorax antillogorgiicola]TCS48675.1 GTP-binding protein [Pseudobacteriovorax antillogorgiicola]SMF54955.1 GTP-binding protein [Pseudobacteriovorax antillogorgiicola]